MSWDQTWEKVFASRSWGKYPSESLIRFIARHFYATPDRKNIKVLEVGCGAGANLWYLSKEGFSAYGIDGSASALKQAESLLTQENQKAVLRIGDIINLPFSDGEFDAVLDVQCLSHNTIENCHKILNEISRILKKDGLFYSRTFSSNTTISKDSKKISDFEYTDIQNGAFSGCGYVKLLNSTQVKELYSAHFILMNQDYSEYTYDNQTIKIAEHVVWGQKLK